ncbi:type IV secretory system conjugative DNA transfer family protein [Staphylococcus equorum]|uniref:VirD4-like conjugal transfer protein, CD1115 family n=1 Tax=Staphylococcus equorum TaxID=246432 RepID=UPI00240841BD|nr:type IV secretory system conjugative DNA transfer family protein [Staphylococcus equorum]MDG0844435.1 type IV secretory system conjugative DNA transfer family protein [Staphylococcus equorum]
MFGSKIKPHFWLKILIIMVVALIPTHLINTLVAMYLNHDTDKPNINEYGDYVTHVMSVTEKTLEVLPIYTPLLFILIFTFLICYLVQGILLDEKGYSEADEVGLHGTSKWGDPDELRNGETLVSKKNSHYGSNLKKNLDMENGYILGKVPEKKDLLIMHDDTEIDNQNVAIIGSSGAGKTQSYVIPNLINIKNKSIIAIDPKGELHRDTAQLKRDQGYQVYQVDFVDFAQSKYNPLYYVETSLEAQKVANNIISNFEKGGDGGSGQFFKNSAINILSALIVFVKTEYSKEEANLEKVVDVYDEHIQDEEHFLKWVEQIDKEHPAKPLLNTIKDLTSDTRKSVTSTLNNGFSLFKLPEVKAMTKRNDFNFEDFINEKAILYVKLSMKDDTFAPLTSVFFNQMINVYYDIANNTGGKLKRKVVFMLDEFANIGKLDDYSKTLATCRGLGLSMHTIIQNRAQLEKKSMYGKEEAADILGNHDTTLLLRADKKDTNTTKWISESLGDTTISQKKNDMTKSKGNISTQLGDNYLKRRLMDPSEVGNLRKKDCILMINGHDPLFLEKAFQAKVFPNLLTKEVVKNGEKTYKYNYDNVRNSLGYTSPVAEAKNYDVEKQLTFSEMDKRKKENELNIKKEAKQEKEAQQESDNKNEKLIENKTESLTQEVVEEVENGNDGLNNLLNDCRAFNDSSDKVNNKDEAFKDMNDEDKVNIVNESADEFEQNINTFKNKANDKANDNSNRSIDV